MGDGLHLIPMLTVAAGLMQVISSITSAASQTPIIPGLAAMSRVGNNHELNALNVMNARARADYFAVTSDFEPPPATRRFWQMFSTRATDAAVDHLVFRCFAPEDGVHHTNYFRNEKTTEFMTEALGL